MSLSRTIKIHKKKNQASGAFGQASGAFGHAFGAFGQTSGAFGQASGAFGQASGAFGQASGAFGQASGAFSQVMVSCQNKEQFLSLEKKTNQPIFFSLFTIIPTQENLTC